MTIPTQRRNRSFALPTFIPYGLRLKPYPKCICERRRRAINVLPYVVLDMGSSSRMEHGTGEKKIATMIKCGAAHSSSFMRRD